MQSLSLRQQIEGGVNLSLRSVYLEVFIESEATRPQGGAYIPRSDHPRELGGDKQ